MLVSKLRFKFLREKAVDVSLVFLLKFKKRKEREVCLVCWLFRVFC